MNPSSEGFRELSLRATAFLDRLAGRERLRQLAPQDFGPTAATRGSIDLTHNDYLGLRADPVLHEARLAAIRTLPLGAGASRLLGGEHPIFEELEQQFARFKGAPAALFFPSGYAANEAVVTSLAALTKAGDLRIFSDALNHASLIDGVRLTGLPPAQRQIFRHNDLDDLEAKLKASTAAIHLIVTESVFSMDGDRADLAALGKLAAQYRGVLLLDEAHAIFCLGRGGRGLAEETGLAADQMITIDTCGKALNAQGAFVCGPTWLRALLVNTARTFIYTTAASPWIAAGLLATLNYSAALDGRRAHLARLASHVRERLASFGLYLGPSSTHIVPLIAGTDGTALRWSAALGELGIAVKAIRPPTVPEGTARLRLSLHAALTDGDCERLLAALSRIAQAERIDD